MIIISWAIRRGCLIAAVLSVFFLSDSAISKAIAAVDGRKEQPAIEIKISAVGDCTLGNESGKARAGSFDDVYQKNSKNPDYFFGKVADIFAQDDLTIVNLEGPLTSSGQKRDKAGKAVSSATVQAVGNGKPASKGNARYFWFKGKPSYAELLPRASVEAANLANNHALDYGQIGYKNTISSLTKNGVIHFGEDKTSVFEKHGKKIAMLGFKVNEYTDGKKICSEIAKTKANGADVVIVSFHWGVERAVKPEASQRKLGKAAIDSGADLVLGHHPHVVQPVETYKGRHIVYSLGNFCFGGNLDPQDKDTFIFKETITISEDGTRKFQANAIPCRISSSTEKNDFQPTPVYGKEAERIKKRIDLQ